MTNKSLLISLIIIPISSILLYLPWQKHLSLFHPATSPSDLNLESCSPIPNLEHCAEPLVVKEISRAYFVCDDSRPWWDPVRFKWQKIPEGRKGGSIWTWDLNDGEPYQLDLLSHREERFHPLSISAAVEKSGTINEHVVLLVSNHPYAGKPGVVDVFKHVTQEKKVVHYERVQDTALAGQSPYKVVAVPEQWGESQSSGLIEGEDTIRIPSFLFSPLALPSEQYNYTAQTTPPSITTYLRSLFWPSIRSPENKIHLHLSSAYTSKKLFSPASTSLTHPITFTTWNGGGSSNTTLNSIYTSSVGAKTAIIEEWDQHWVRGQLYGTEKHLNKKTWKEVLIRWPDFVTFWNVPQQSLTTGVDVDSLGRLWTVSTSSHGMTEQRIEDLANGLPSDQLTRTGGTIHQMTYLHRLGISIAHPWEVSRLASAKKRGIWLPKEFYSTLVYRSSSKQGPMPNAPTGIAVDEDRQRVIVTSSWDHKVAACKWKEGWVEMQMHEDENAIKE
ncbi:unnamed protein product [Sympodiomycopsis kandeliae]